jgi:hypothetical protein
MSHEEEKDQERASEGVLEDPNQLENDHTNSPVVGITDAETTNSSPQQQNDDKRIKMKVAADAPWTDRMWEVFCTFWPLGLIAFGGPQAHVAILRDRLVVQRDWLDEEQFMELFAIGQV